MIRVFMVGYSSHKGGVETYIDNLCSKLNKEKYEVVYSMPKMAIDGKTWIRPNNRHNYFGYLSFWKKFFKQNKFDVVYYNTCDIVSLDILKFAKSAGVPVRILHSHSSGIQQKLNAFHEACEKLNHKLVNKYANCFFACSDVAGNYLFDDGNFVVIKNGVNIESYKYNLAYRKNCRQQIGVKDELLIGMIGRISSVKNPFFAVEIMKQLCQKQPNVKFVFIGDGDLKNDVQKFVHDEGLEDKVVFIGSVDNVNEWLSALDCLIMPSFFEGLPFVLVEAQASGLSCVVSNNVTAEANLTGLVEFLDLEDESEKWVNIILECCKKNRIDTRVMLSEKGYSIENTANYVMSIIESHLN